MSELFVALFFRFFNFLIVLLVCLYAIVRYLLPDIKEQFWLYLGRLETLRRSHHSLQKETRMIKRGIEADREFQEQLIQNVKAWRSIVYARRDALLQEREARKAALEAQVKEHEKQLRLYRAYRQIMPDAIEQARSALYKRFADRTAQDAFLNTVMRKAER